MVVRIRFRVGPRVGRKKGKNTRLAWVAAGFLTLGSVSCLIFALWRLGVDFGWAGEFVFPDTSVLSHWQVWLAISVVIQWAAWRLNRYGKPKPPEAAPADSQQVESKPEKKELAANA
jgi:hypothetical protein